MVHLVVVLMTGMIMTRETTRTRPGPYCRRRVVVVSFFFRRGVVTHLGVAFLKRSNPWSATQGQTTQLTAKWILRPLGVPESNSGGDKDKLMSA